MQAMTEMQVNERATVDLFPISEMNDLTVILAEDEKILSITNNDEGIMELPVNNYLKTPDEMELEFRYGINPRSLNLGKSVMKAIAPITKTDGFPNIHDPDAALRGFMEENY